MRAEARSDQEVRKNGDAEFTFHSQQAQASPLVPVRPFISVDIVRVACEVADSQVAAKREGFRDQHTFRAFRYCLGAPPCTIDRPSRIPTSTQLTSPPSYTHHIVGGRAQRKAVRPFAVRSSFCFAAS